MRKLIAVTVFAFAVPALADAPMAPPKPDAAMDAWKPMMGSWSCEGSTKMGTMTIKNKGTAKFEMAKNLDGFFVQMNYDDEKTKENPMPGHLVAFYGYDSAMKMTTFMGLDNMGASWSGTGKMDKASSTFAGKGRMMGMDAEFKETWDMKDAKTTHVAGSMGGASWDLTCKK
jgi:hypothetical protein